MKPLFNKDHTLNLPSYSFSAVTSAQSWKRFLSFFVDIYLCSLFFIPLLSFFSQTFDSVSLFNTSQNTIILVIAFYFSFCMFFYFVLLQYCIGQTIGMMFFNLKLHNYKEGNITFFQCVIRNLFLLPILPLSFIWIIDLGYYLFFGQRLLEKFSSTLLVHTITMHMED